MTCSAVNEFKHTEEFVIKIKYFKKAWKITSSRHLAQKMYQTKNPSQGLVSLPPFELRNNPSRNGNIYNATEFVGRKQQSNSGSITRRFQRRNITFGCSRHPESVSTTSHSHNILISLCPILMLSFQLQVIPICRNPRVFLPNSPTWALVFRSKVGRRPYTHVIKN